MKRCLLVAMLLCVTIAGFAKREKIYLNDRRRSLMPPIEAYIDGQVLELGISDELKTLDIVIEDVAGNIVFVPGDLHGTAYNGAGMLSYSGRRNPKENL